MKNWSLTFLVILAFIWGVLALYTTGTACAYDLDNDFIQNAFPGKIISRTFTIPVDQKELMVVYPGAAESTAKELQSHFTRKCGQEIPFRMADNLKEEDLQGKHLIVIGNISNNRWTLELYKRRYAFADVCFPGKGGVIIHPVTSIWDANRYVLVIGVSSDNDIVMGFETFLSLLKDGVKTIETIHHLKTSHTFPEAPGSVASILDGVRKDINIKRVSYGLMPDWGLYYYLTGDTKWAEHFRDGMYLLYERGEKTGKWIPEPWTNVYFLFWKMVLVWDLLDQDPFFSMSDRKIIEEVLWGYFNFCRGGSFPFFASEWCLPGEMRQNHSTFMALSLFYAHRYFTEKYGIAGIDDVVPKFKRCFDGQAQSYRPNDDAGGYLNYGVTHTLNYLMTVGDDSYLESGRLRSAADLTVATIDNRKDPVSFGDRGGYAHRRKGSPRGREDKFLSMAAWYYNDSQYQWVNNWRTRESSFSLESLYSGDYAVEIPEKSPVRFLGVHPIFLDETALRWSARRTDKNSHIPLEGKRYIDKMAFRASFNPEDEYLLLDGTSTFAHGHHDGNTVTRLTWKDHIWLIDADYIKLTPQYHNGVIVVKDGIQEEPPPLTVLDYSADFDTFGLSRTTSGDFNGADWERNIIWKKGEYFLFLDTINALEDGKFRLECRWRTLGDVNLSGNVLSVKNGDTVFFIKSADKAYRRIADEREVSVCLARKNMPLKIGSNWTFANLMYVNNESDEITREIYKVGDGTYMIGESDNIDNIEIVSMNADMLADEGIYTDCGLFILNSSSLWLLDTAFLKFKDMCLKTDSKVYMEIDYRKRAGILLVPDGKEVTCKTCNLSIKGKNFSKIGQADYVKLSPGEYTLMFRESLWDSGNPLKAFSTSAREVSPEFLENVQDFGLEVIKEFKVTDPVTAIFHDGEALLCGDAEGRITRFEKGESREQLINCQHLFRISPEHRIVSLYTADLNGDGVKEFLVGDGNQNLYCYESSGKCLWSYRMSPYFGGNASATDITVGDIDNSGENTILVATSGWKLYAFKPDGTVKWESFIYYHPLTKVKILKNKNKTYIAVGTVYSTPLNIVNPDDGKVIWFTWEQVGDEFLSVTRYCGIHLTDMIFLDTDLDGEKDIVFGTKYNRVYALNAADGSTKWEANIGDEVTVMKEITCQTTGEKRIVVATGAGDLIILDRTGKRLNMISFESGISDMEILAYPEHGRNDIIVSTVDGRVIICDDDFIIRASTTQGNTPLKSIIPGGKSGDDHLFYCVSDYRVQLIKYHPCFLRKSRYY